MPGGSLRAASPANVPRSVVADSPAACLLEDRPRATQLRRPPQAALPKARAVVTAAGVRAEPLGQVERSALCQLPKGSASVAGLLGGSLVWAPWAWAWSLGSAGLGCQDLSSRNPVVRNATCGCEEVEAGSLLPSRQLRGRVRAVKI